jgi:nucleoside-diphosphate-sugar epimerase
MARILIAGCGYVGTACAVQLLADGHTVFGLRRNPEGLPDGVHRIAADLCNSESLHPALAEVEHGGIDAVVYAAAADRGDEESYRRIYVDGLRHVSEWAQRQGMRTPHLLFTSSTAVYTQTDGSWVDESSPTEPTQFNGACMLEAEGLLAGRSGGGTVLRLGGLYGPGRTRLVESVRTGRASIRPGPPRWTNRIHRDDAAGALRHLLIRGLAGGSLDPVYIGVDEQPADEAEVLRWLAATLGADPPPVASGSAPATGREGRSGSNKRCDSRRLRAAGYRFRYPTYREGYTALIDASRKR